MTLLGVATLAVGAAIPAMPFQTTPAAAVMEDGPTGFTQRPNEPRDPEVKFHEDFENIDKTGPYVPLVEYQSVDGIEYTAEGPWADPVIACNGFVAAGTSEFDDACNGNSDSQGGLTALADVLGQVNGTADPRTNSVVAAYTSGDPYPPGLIQFSTVGETIPAPTANRFFTFSVNVAATSCWVETAQPLMRFSIFRTEGGLTVEEPISGADAINPCTDPRAQAYRPSNAPSADLTFFAGTFTSGGSFLTPPGDPVPIGVLMRNDQGGTAGNDAAFDDIQMYDATPHLNKEFLPERLPVGETSTLTFTVTNTSEFAAKDGWAFTDTLRSGLEPTGDVGGTCDATTAVEFDGSAHRIEVTDGVLATGEESCTIEVGVTSQSPSGAEPSPVRYFNDASDISDVIGLDATNETWVDFYSEPALGIVKTSDAADESRQVGDTIDYTVEVTNTGTQDLTVANPAVFTDDLSGVLDDAAWNDDATVSFDQGSTAADPVLDGQTLRWSGPLKAGETATFGYSVTLTQGGDRAVDNSACVTADGVEAQCDATESVKPALTIKKISSATGVLPDVGDTVTYEVTITNTGPGDYTAANPATAHDDLSDVIDDADFVVASLNASTGTVTLEADHSAWDWEGALAAGESATISYEVIYQTTGDFVLENTACVPEGDTAEIGDENCATVTTTGPFIITSKSSDPVSGTALIAGQEVTYTLSFANIGGVAGPVSKIDDMTHLLDDATLVSAPVASSSALAVDEQSPGVYSISGNLAANETATVTYTAQVNEDGDRGDDVLANFLMSPGTPTPSEPVCVPDPAEDISCTEHPVSVLVPSKSSDPASGTTVSPGETITYTLSFENTGNVAAAVDFVDVLTDVLDDGTIVESPIASGTLSADLSGNSLVVSGSVAPGETATVTYQVVVNEHVQQGNYEMTNFLTAAGKKPPTECVDGSSMCTSNPVEKPAEGLALTGSEPAWYAGAAVLLLVAGGIALVVVARRTHGLSNN